MKGLKQQLSRIKNYDEELEEMIRDAGFVGSAAENDIQEFYGWEKETNEPYGFVMRTLEEERKILQETVRNMTDNNAIMDHLLDGNYKRAEREIEAAYQLEAQDLEVKA